MTTMKIADPMAPAAVEIEGLHLSITQRWDSGGSHNIHLIENGDITIALGHGGSLTPGDVGTLVISLDVDGDHDEVQVQYNGVSMEEAVAQATEALRACGEALRRMRKAARS